MTRQKRFSVLWFTSGIAALSLAGTVGCDRNDPPVIPAASHGAEATEGKAATPAASTGGTQDAARFQPLEKATNPPTGSAPK